MKYLYKILRLFFCPHKYGKIVTKGNIVNSDKTVLGKFYDKECNYCGRIRAFNT